MNKSSIILAFLLIATIAFSQKKEKIKGSKIVTVAQKVIGDFDQIDVADNLEVFLIKGDKCGIEIEADDNLHDIIKIDLVGKNLRLSTLRQVTGFKKFVLRVTYNDSFKTVVSHDEAVITALAELTLDNITFNSFQESKLFLNVRVKNFALKQDDKSKAELNLKAESAIVELSKNAQIKALVNGTDLKMDLYQKGKAEIEGDVMNVKLRLDNDASFAGKKLTVKSMDLITELDTSCSVNVNTLLNITATGSSQVEIYGNPVKYDLKKFADSARLIKKVLK